MSGERPAPPVLPPVPPPAAPPVLFPPVPGGGAPRVLVWYRLYLGAMAALYAGCLAVGIVLIWYREEFSGWAGRGEDPRTLLVYGVVLAAMGALLHSVYFAAFFLPRRPWAWVVHIVLIAIGLTSCCTMPAAIPLLVAWLKPETQAWFGRGPRSV